MKHPKWGPISHLQHLQLSTILDHIFYLAILFWLTDVHQGHWITYIWYTRVSGFSSNCFCSSSGLVGGCLPAQSRTCATRRVGGKGVGFHGDINSIHHKIVNIYIIYIPIDVCIDGISSWTNPHRILSPWILTCSYFILIHAWDTTWYSDTSGRTWFTFRVCQPSTTTTARATFHHQIGDGSPWNIHCWIDPDGCSMFFFCLIFAGLTGFLKYAGDGMVWYGTKYAK